MKTVFNQKETTNVFTTNYPYKMEDNDTITFEITGQTPERTLEDRSVYLNVKTKIDESKCNPNPVNFNMWR